MNPISRVLRWSLIGASLAAAGAQAATLHFYKLQPSTLTAAQADALAAKYKLTQVRSQTGAPTGVYAMADGSVRFVFARGAFHFLPAVQGLQGAPPTAAELQKTGMAFINQFGLASRNAVLVPGPTSVWSKGTGSPTGDAKPEDLLRTQTFNETLDGYPVVGPSSILSVTGGAAGINGAEVTLLPAVQLPDLTVLPKSENQIILEFNMKARLHVLRGSYKAVARRLVYFEQGLGYIQPAYMFDTQFTDSTGMITGDSIVVPLARNCPEAVRSDIDTQNVPPIYPDKSLTTAESFNLDQLLASTAAAQANPVSVGQYIVREDSPSWLNDAQAFWTNLNLSHAIAFWRPYPYRRDYWWDEPWCWEPALGVADNSPYFVNQDNLIQKEGHGAPWEITCYKNYGDVIDLTKIAGYGANRLNGKTAWCIWQSCDVIPVPGDAYGGLWTSGSPFNVWWNIFKGMRGNFGYHTTMGIANGVGSLYGYQIGLGFPMVSAWLNCTSNCPQGHPGGWNYGSCVIVSGHEGDTFYDTAGVPNPSSLTMWWIHA